MTCHVFDRSRVETVRLGQVANGTPRCQLVGKTDTVCYFRTELEPLEIQIHAKTDLAEIIRQVEHNRFLPVTAGVETDAATTYHVWSEIAHPFG